MVINKRRKIVETLMQSRISSKSIEFSIDQDVQEFKKKIMQHARDNAEKQLEELRES